jgi:hypothetical protein
MRKRIILLGIIAIGAVVFTTCKKEGGIQGIVTDKTNAEPIRATGVELHEKNKLLTRTVTYDDGQYEFNDLKAGDYKIRIDAEGYEEVNYDVMVQSGKIAKADIQLGTKAPDMPYITLQSAGIMVQKQDIGTGTWSTINTACENSTLAGYSDWRLPTQSELDVLYQNRVAIGGFTTSGSNTFYWSSTVYGNNYHWHQDFSSGAQYTNSNDLSYRGRCVRNY